MTRDGSRAGEPVVTGVDGGRLLDRLAELAELGAVGAVDGGGVTRLAWSPEDRAAVALVASWAEEAGATVWRDGVGNLVAELPGTDPGLAPLGMGSHLDTVVGAGTLDGAYGVVAGIEILAALAGSTRAGSTRAGSRLRHPLRVAAFVNEEGVVAPPFTGSRAVAGQDLEGEMDHRGPDGRTLRERIAAADGAQRNPVAAWGPVAGYLEIHVEQGPVLDARGLRAGVVTAITGQARALVEWSGRPNHAGTTPMDLRHDALVAAAQGVLEVEGLARDGMVAVATVGRLDVHPNVPNVIPGAVTFTVDIRSVDDAATDAALARLADRLEAVAHRTGTEVRVVPTSRSAAVPTDPRWRHVLHAACAAHGVEALELPSGAGHDAQHLAAVAPVGMLFVPSVGGVSHHSAEATAGDDLVLGARIALDALLAADRTIDAGRSADADRTADA